jgi:thioredoxin 1
MLILLKTSSQLVEALSKNTTILLDFSASWCGPCRTLKPVLESLSERYASIPFYYVDTEEAEEALLDKFQIQALPTVKLIQGGETVYTMLGARPQELTAVLEKVKI